MLLSPRGLFIVLRNSLHQTQITSGTGVINSQGERIEENLCAQNSWKNNDQPLTISTCRQNPRQSFKNYKITTTSFVQNILIIFYCAQHN